MVRAFLFILFAVAACGPSSAQIKTAKTATYATKPGNVFDIAVQVVQRTYKLGAIDISKFKLTTLPQFYNDTGGRQSAGANGFVTAQGGSVSLTMIVEVLYAGPGDDRVIVKVTPKTYQVISWSPQPRELAPDDPNLPPWILGRANSLALEIYEHAKRYVQN